MGGSLQFHYFSLGPVISLGTSFNQIFKSALRKLNTDDKTTEIFDIKCSKNPHRGFQNKKNITFELAQHVQ